MYIYCYRYQPDTIQLLSANDLWSQTTHSLARIRWPKDVTNILPTIDLLQKKIHNTSITPSLEHCKFLKKGVCWKPT